MSVSFTGFHPSWVSLINRTGVTGAVICTAGSNLQEMVPGVLRRVPWKHSSSHQTHQPQSHSNRRVQNESVEPAPHVSDHLVCLSSGKTVDADECPVCSGDHGTFWAEGMGQLWCLALWIHLHANCRDNKTREVDSRDVDSLSFGRSQFVKPWGCYEDVIFFASVQQVVDM